MEGDPDGRREGGGEREREGGREGEREREKGRLKLHSCVCTCSSLFSVYSVIDQDC